MTLRQTHKQVQAKKSIPVARRGKSRGWLEDLRVLLRRRQIADGMRLLDRTEPVWGSLGLPERQDAELLMLLAQWVDVGYREPRFLRSMLDLISTEVRLQMDVRAFVRIRMAEAFYSLALDDAEDAIRTLDILLRLDESLLEPEVRMVAHLWKGRAHRRQADYQRALEHIHAACELAAALPDSHVVLAVIQVQQGWLFFQLGAIAKALETFNQAEAVLARTDHWIALGNIESARGRMIRRKGDYLRAVDHFTRAIAFYERRHPHHPNLARAVTNLAFVKRLLALQLRKHIDESAARRAATGASAHLRPLHQQYQDLYQSAIAELERAKQICMLHQHHNALAAALLNAGYLHLDVGDLELADHEAAEAYRIGASTRSAVLMARARILAGLIQNAHVEELLGQPGDAPAFASRARQLCVEAVALAESTQNKRVLVNAHIALGEVAANDFFHDYDLARRCADSAAALIDTDDADYVVDELNALKAKLLRTLGIDDTLREWSQGITGGKSLQEVLDEFAQLVVTQMWLREDQKISRVARLLAMSPRKVRRLVKHAELVEPETRQTDADRSK